MTRWLDIQIVWLSVFWVKENKKKESFSIWVQVARRIAIMEVDLERAEDRAEAAEA